MPYRGRTSSARVLGIAVLAMIWSAPGLAQEWAYYANREYQFTAMFPGEPAARDIEYRTANGLGVPAREFSARRGEGQYLVTVVDYSAQPDEMEGAVAHAAENVRQKGMVRYDEFAQLNGIPGHAVSVVAPDGRQTLTTIYLYENRLYITEGSEAANGPPPAHFSMSIDITYADGTGVNLNPGGATTRAELLEIQRQQQESSQQP